MQEFSAEMRLAIACVRWPRLPQHDDEVAGLVRGGIDWGCFLRLVDRHRIIGLAYHALDAADALPPAPHRKDLALAALKLRWTNQKLAAETARLQARLDSEGITATFFKGATLAQLAYGTVDLKHSKDIDFLVGPEEVPATIALLREEGYREWMPGRLTAAQWRNAIHFLKEIAMVNADRGVQVEPHWRLSWNPRMLDWLDTSRPTVDVELAGLGRARTFGADDLFVYLASHGSGHSWFRLKWLGDFVALFGGLSAQELEAKYHYAAERGAGTAALVALGMAEHVFGLALTEALRERSRRDRAAGYLRRIALRSLVSDEGEPGWRDSHATQLVLAARQKALLPQIWQTVAADVLDVPLPRPLWFLFPLLRLPMGAWRLVRRRTGVHAPAARVDPAG